MCRQWCRFLVSTPRCCAYSVTARPSRQVTLPRRIVVLILTGISMPSYGVLRDFEAIFSPRLPTRCSYPPRTDSRVPHSNGTTVPRKLRDLCRALRHHACDEPPILVAIENENTRDERQRSFEPQHAGRALSNSQHFSSPMGSVIGSHAIDDAIDKCLAQGESVALFA